MLRAHSPVIAVLPAADAGLLTAFPADPAVACWHCWAVYCDTDLVSMARHCFCYCHACPTLYCGSSYCAPVSYWQFVSCWCLMRRVISFKTVQWVIFCSVTEPKIKSNAWTGGVFLKIFFSEQIFFFLEVFLILMQGWKIFFLDQGNI